MEGGGGRPGVCFGRDGTAMILVLNCYQEL